MNWVLPTLLIAGVAAFVANQTGVLDANNFALAISRAKISKITWSGIKFNFDINLTNLSNIPGALKYVKVDLYYIQPNGAPRYLTQANVGNVNIGANTTVNVPNIQLTIPYTVMADNLDVIKQGSGTFRAVIKGYDKREKEVTLKKDFIV